MILPFMILLSGQVVAVDFFSCLQRTCALRIGVLPGIRGTQPDTVEHRRGLRGQRVATATRPRASRTRNTHFGVPALAFMIRPAAT
jgi:hypothetical protein